MVPERPAAISSAGGKEHLNPLRNLDPPHLSKELPVEIKGLPLLPHRIAEDFPDLLLGDLFR